MSMPKVTTNTDGAAALVAGSDAGGRRWFLQDRPVHAGTGLEMGIVLDYEWVESEGRDRPIRWLWLSVRLEFDYSNGHAEAYIPTAGGFRHLHGRVPDGVLFRWPKSKRAPR